MIVLASLIGIVIGIIVGALGAGGGILSVPVLVYLLGQSPHDAAAGSLVIVGLTALVSLISHARSGTVHWPDGVLFGLLSVAGSFVGSRLNARVDATVLMVSFCALLCVISATMVRRAVAEKKASSAVKEKLAPEPVVKTNWLLVFLAATVTGFLTGFFGVGGGFVVVPMLMLVLHFLIKDAASTSLVVMVIASASGLLSRVGTDVSVDWGVIAVFAAGSMVGGVIGPKLTKNAKDYVLTAVFAALLGAVAAVTFVGTVLGY